MKTSRMAVLLFAFAVATTCIGCNAPGKPKPSSEALRPEQVMDFTTLYTENCAACHGEHGQHGAVISLANPVYLAFAGKGTLQRVVSEGVHGTLMPAFSKTKGGALTDQQIDALAQGMINAWGSPGILSGQQPPPYSSGTTGDKDRGQQVFAAHCSRCHGFSGTGVQKGSHPTGSLVDSAYLALVSNQSLRSTILAGRPEDQMPDWRSDSRGLDAHPMTDQEIADTVTWLTSQRSATPGQPYQQHP